MAVLFLFLTGPTLGRPLLSSTIPALALSLCSAAVAVYLPLAMAVDRAKFRTCAQTSFCRRHRHGKSRRLYDYRLVADSVAVHRRGDGAPDAGGDVADGVGDGAAPPEAGGLLSRVSRRFLERLAPSTDGPAGGGGEDQVRGPAPVLTARLANDAPLTSTALSARAAGGCPGASFAEELELSVHLHADGVARLRLKEVADGHAARSAPRWTADEMVLNEAEMVGAPEEGVRVAATHPAVRRRLAAAFAAEDGGQRDEDGEAAADARLIASLNRRAAVAGASADNYVVLSYGGPDAAGAGGGEGEAARWQLMLQLAPFAAYFFRADDAGPPMVVAGTGGLTHFEVRRHKDCQGSAAAAPRKRQLTEFDVDSEDDSEDEDEEGEGEAGGEGEKELDRHGGKEIVGYWEDGLAIYADGTREERRDAADASEERAGEDVAAEQGRRLAEEEHFDTQGMWEEKFGDHHDSKPFGPTSVGMELTFPASRHLFGLPEHASSTQLRATTGEGRHYDEPYRLYNLDVFEYELDETMALYGHIPLVVSQSTTTGTAGAFWFNPTETFVDVAEEEAPPGGAAAPASRTHFLSESGIVDLFLLPGPDPAALYGQYARLTGRLALPPMFALGYHQCRWNYRDQADVYAVHGKFEELDYPYDVLWLDIEHTDGKRYFTWDDKAFPDPAAMQKKLGGQGRRMVTIIDPHIKRDNGYYIHKQATSRGLYIKDKKGEKDYEGWCWPGSSSYLDFTQERVRQWWAEQFQYSKYKGSTPDLFTWNDMNEPSVFNGPEVSMQKDLLNLDGLEHREWHNLYGMLFHRATAEGLIQRNEGHNVRPFVLSRSFFAGSQRYGAIWTGDNEAKWSHLAIAAPMLLSLNVGALSFVGADVGGFFGNTDAELMTRWMQVTLPSTRALVFLNAEIARLAHFSHLTCLCRPGRTRPSSGGTRTTTPNGGSRGCSATRRWCGCAGRPWRGMRCCLTGTRSFGRRA